MKKYIYLILFIIPLFGCTALKNVSSKDTSVKKDIVVREIKEDVTSEETHDHVNELENIKSDKIEEYTIHKGVIFAKTDFLGVLKTSYVRLTIENIEDSNLKYKLYIGDKSSKNVFPWDSKVVKPGYFFIELPIGKYKISSISIPVGSTMAEENFNVFFEVIPNSITYIGTLRVDGLKEKIKLGGVPVIKPGFEYKVEVVDQRGEGILAFKKQYPNFSNEILIKLMQIKN